MFLAPVAAPGGKPGERPPPPKHKVFRAERMRIDCMKNLKIFKFFQILIKMFLKTFKNFLKAFKIFN